MRRVALTGIFFLAVVFFLPIGWAQQSSATVAEELLPAMAPVSREIPRPPALQRDVDFWIRVYSEITTLQGFMHDERHLGVIYETLDLAAQGPAGSASRRQLISRSRERWTAALEEAAALLEATPAAAFGSPVTPGTPGTPGTLAAAASADARRVLELWGSEATPARLREARAEARFQLGQADRFRAGIVRSGTWESHIARTLDRLGLPPELAALPHVESSFTPNAYSKVGASGLWQFMPGTGRLYMRVDDIVDERLDPFRSTEAAAKLLLNNYRVLGSWPLALTAYNHGAGGMRRAKRMMGTDDFAVIARNYRSRSFGFASRNFYPSFLAALTIDLDAQRYFPGVVRAPEMRFQEVEMPGYADINRLETALGVPMAQLRDLNPALRPAVLRGDRFVPRGYRLRLPTGEGEGKTAAITAEALIARVGAENLYVSQIGPRVHRVARGETLHQVARKYGFSVQRIAQLNGLPTNAKLKRGRVLQLPDERPATLADLSANAASGMPAASSRP
ncbi:MAG: transglycosylase SLT domain-containing protein [Gammaproteobacteria bacterium]|nr:transglycosylase SLT domain-containing protein [Gammaproteobacteria bacterium]